MGVCSYPAHIIRIIEGIDFKFKLNYFWIISVYAEHYCIDGGRKVSLPASVKKSAAAAPPPFFPVSSALGRELARIEIS